MYIGIPASPNWTSPKRPPASEEVRMVALSQRNTFGSWTQIFLLVELVEHIEYNIMSICGEWSVYQWWEKGSSIYGTTSKAHEQNVNWLKILDNKIYKHKWWPDQLKVRDHATVGHRYRRTFIDNQEPKDTLRSGESQTLFKQRWHF